MLKVTLLGDSIRMIGYGPVVPGLLGGDFQVWQPAENCRFAKYTLRGLFEWAEGMKDSDIVHWNCGLWDFCDLFGDGVFTEEGDYVKTILRVTDILTARYKKVIFATTTPVDPTNPYYDNALTARRNALVVPLLRERGVLINDLYTPVAEDLDKYIREDKIHLSEAGIALCAGKVADAIRAAARDLTGGTAFTATADTTGAPV